MNQSPPPVATHGLTHLALAVRNVEKAFAFYQSVFGAVLVYQSDGFIQAQTPGSRDVLVFEEKGGDPGTSGGIAHFGFRLKNPAAIDAAAAVIKAAGGTVLEQGEFCPGEPYLFARDVDGYLIEVWFEIPTPADPPT